MRPTKKRSRRRRLITSLLLLLVLILGLSFGSWFYFVDRYTHTPNVVGLPESLAIQTLQKDHLSARVSQHVYSARYASGDVVSTNPGANARVLKQSTVQLVISLGKPLVPKLVGLTQGAATSKLKVVDLQVGTITLTYSDTVKSGIVIKSTPSEGTALAPNEAVELTVSKGRAPVRIPDLTGKPESSSVQRLKALGLKVVITGSSYSNTVAADHILTQSPAGVEGHRGDTVRLTISKGHAPVQIPSGLVGMSAGAARQELEGLGFKVDELVTNGFGIVVLNRVVGTSPGAGTTQPYGSTVTLDVV